MSRSPATTIDPSQLALALFLLWGVLSPSVACTSRAAHVDARLDGPDVGSTVVLPASRRAESRAAGRLARI
jgi:hypothetical protein